MTPFALSLIRQEIARNRKEITELLDNHKSRADGLMAAAGVLYKGRPADVEIDPAFPVHQSSVFDAAMADRTLSPLDWGTLLLIVESYSSHAWLLFQE